MKQAANMVKYRIIGFSAHSCPIADGFDRPA
jgi:hypothetical protein